MTNLSSAARASRVYLAQVYLGDDTPETVRGMCEMTVIKLGEIVDQPQRRRVKMIEKQAEEARAAKEAREREASKSATEREERARQQGMNERAYAECRERWKPLVDAMAAGCELSDGHRALAKRVSHRAELKLIVLELDAVRLAPCRATEPSRMPTLPSRLRPYPHPPDPPIDRRCERCRQANLSQWAPPGCSQQSYGPLPTRWPRPRRQAPAHCASPR